MEKMEINEKAGETAVIRTRRVGTITAGVTLIFFGALFIAHTMFSSIELEMIYKCWPFVLVGLGVEMLLSNKNDRKYVYDKAAIFVMIMMTGFSMMMALAEMCFKYIK